MITFLLNNRTVQTGRSPGMPLIDFIRYDQGLRGAKVGCREGDCGACTVLEGVLTDNNGLVYKSIVSCLTPLANAHGKHIVTVEGLNLENRLSPVQRAMVDNAATQCGFCTPGFVVSFTGHCLSRQVSTVESAITSVSGNICRCTGYKSIERAASDIAQCAQHKDIDNPVGWMVERGYLPRYFLQIPDRLRAIEPIGMAASGTAVIAGGTDLMAKRADAVYASGVTPILDSKELKGISIDASRCRIGASTTVNELMQSAQVAALLPSLKEQLLLVSSEAIRNSGTVGGNIVNASPIGDLSIILLALNSEITTLNGGRRRVQPLREFFRGYKSLDLQEGELVEAVHFPIPQEPYYFSFEKVSKRTHLDIASVNSAMLIRLSNGRVAECHLSAGGVSPIPLYLKETSQLLVGKDISTETLSGVSRALQSEISPIADIRGSVEYKRLLLKQLVFAHFLKLFPDKLPGTAKQ